MIINRQSIPWLVAAGVSVVLFCGPAAIWLQARDSHARPTARPDVVYLVAGARHQDLRVDAATRWLRRAAYQPRILVGNDVEKGWWSSAAQRNLTMGEWAAVKLRRSLAVNPVLNELRLDIVPGLFNGTDGEMAALADFLARTPEVRHVAVVTSAFHVRRTVSRLRHHIDGSTTVSAIPAESCYEDYLPWVVLGELLKLCRDSVGLASMPLISRTAWFDEHDAWITAVFFLLVYAWVLYPALIGMWARRKTGPAAGTVREPAETVLPHVSVIIAAHNEAAHIGARVRNLLDQQWPAGAMDLWIGSDGSSDRTVEAAREASSGNPRVHVVAYEARRGKAAVLKDLITASAEAGRTAGVRDDILVFTDANTEFVPGSLRALIDAFDDQGVGGACGRLVFTHGGETSSLDGVAAGTGGEETGYWDWETRMKRGESRLDSCLGANGAIYAVRRNLFWDELPANTIVDDFVIGMKVREQGRRMVYVEEALALESLPPSTRDEWRRRVRIGAGAFQALVMCRRCLLPRYGRFAWMFWSHKVLRWVTPHLLLLLVALTCFAISARVVEGRGLSVGLVVGGGVMVLLLVAPLGMLFANRRGSVARLMRLAWYFVQIQAAMLVGSLRFCRGGLSGAWERTRR